MAASKTLKCDALIVGGGLVGATLALALARGGLSVVVVDRDDPAAMVDAAYDGRTCAIALAGQRVLAGVGAWSAMADQAQPIADIRVADGRSLLFLHYDHRQLGTEPFGYIVENRVTRLALQGCLATATRITLKAPARLETVVREAGGVRARLADGTRVDARLLVGADGRNSAIRAQAGIGVYQWRYGQSGIVCTVAHERPHHGVAVEHFLPAGPFAILPMTRQRASIVWTEKDPLVPVLMGLDDDEFLFELQRRFGDYLGRLRLEGPRFAYPLALHHAYRYTDTRLALLGDAAHGMHPLAGQGLNMGLRDVAALAEAAVDAHRLGLEIGTAPMLRDYERWRRFDNTLMLALTDVMNRLFSNDIAPLRLARDIGLAAVDRMPPLKRVFMRHAMGLVGDLPRLMRGDAL